jgi:hypothetical protein
MLATPAMAGAFDAIARLATVFHGRVWIVSKAGPRIQANTELWLAHHEFFSKTSIPSEHIRFVRKRTEKATVCEQLGVTHFVDDRIDVLQALVGVVPHLFLFGPQDRTVPQYAVAVPTWADAELQIMRLLST